MTVVLMGKLWSPKSAAWWRATFAAFVAFAAAGHGIRRNRRPVNAEFHKGVNYMAEVPSEYSRKVVDTTTNIIVTRIKWLTSRIHTRRSVGPAVSLIRQVRKPPQVSCWTGNA